MVKYPKKPDAVYYFGTCLVDLIYPQAGMAGIKLIQREGVEVIFPQNQTCCGQPAFNAGHQREAREVAASQVGLFPKDIPNHNSVWFMRGNDSKTLSETV